MYDQISILLWMDDKWWAHTIWWQFGNEYKWISLLLMSLLLNMQPWSSLSSWWAGSPVLHRVECEVCWMVSVMDHCSGRHAQHQCSCFMGRSPFLNTCFQFIYNPSLQTYTINKDSMQWEKWCTVLMCIHFTISFSYGLLFPLFFFCTVAS